MPCGQQLELLLAGDAVELGGDAGSRPIRAAAGAPAHCEHLQIRAALEQAFDQQQIVARLVVLIHAGGRERAQQIHRLEHQPGAPAHRLPPRRDPPARRSIRNGEPVETVQQTRTAALGHLPTQIEQTVAVGAGHLLEDKPRTATTELHRVAADGGGRVIDDHAHPAAVALPHQPQIDVVIHQRRVPEGLAQRIAIRQRKRRREPLAAHLEHVARRVRAHRPRRKRQGEQHAFGQRRGGISHEKIRRTPTHFVRELGVNAQLAHWGVSSGNTRFKAQTATTSTPPSQKGGSRGRSPIGANLSSAWKVALHLDSAFAWRVGERAGDFAPALDHFDQREPGVDRVLDLVEDELELTPAAAAASGASRSPRGKGLRRGEGSFR